MTNLTELTVRAAALQSELAEVQRQIAAAKTDRWALQNMEAFLYSEGEAGETAGFSDWQGWGGVRDHGLLAATVERAEALQRFRRAHWKLRTLTGDFVPDWDDKSQDKWCPAYDHYNKYWTVCCRLWTFQPGAVYFPSKEAAIAAREAMGDQMDDLLFDFNRP